MSNEMSRATLLRLGWVNIKTIKTVAPSFAGEIRRHVTEGRVDHARNTEGYRHTNWYRLTPKGKEWVYHRRDNWAAKAFKIVPAAQLEVGRDELWKRGWDHAYPKIYGRHVSGAEKLGLLELRLIKRGKRHILYVRMTPGGEKFYQDFLRYRNKLGLKKALSKVRTEKSRRKHRREFAEKLRKDLKSNLTHFVHDCERLNTLKLALSAQARSLGTKI